MLVVERAARSAAFFWRKMLAKAGSCWWGDNEDFWRESLINDESR
jgi:hypothetical protein